MNILAIITEEVRRLFEQKQYSIPELAGLMDTRMKHGKQTADIYLKMLQDAYKQGGDQAVVDMYTKLSGVQIEAIRNGRYMFANLCTPPEYDNPHLEEVQDNSDHRPDEMPS